LLYAWIAILTDRRERPDDRASAGALTAHEKVAMSKRLVQAALASSLAAAVAGCFQPVRPSDVHLKPEPAPAATAPGNIPTPVPLSAALPKPRPALKPETYSVVVNQVPVSQLLFALARDARLNVDIHPGIQGAVTLNAIEQTLPQLLSRIAKQVDMRWELDGPNLSVMPDSPYLRNYRIDYVNMERATTGTVSVQGQVSSGPAAGGAGGTTGAGGATAANASTVTVRNTTINKFWATLVDNIQDILRETDKIIPGSAPGQPGAAPAPAAAGAPAGGAASPGTPGTPPIVVQPAVQFREAASVIANPEAGVITIRATARQHERIQEFLDQVLANVGRQVLIEGTIVEVTLSNQYQQGIDWSKINGLSSWRFFQGNLQPNIGTLTATPTGSFGTVGFASREFNAVIRLLETFGSVRVLSSPRLSVLNNQTALLRVVDNLVYFTVTSNTTANVNVSNTTFTTTPNVVPIGFVMNVTPFIAENDAVTLNLKPSISRVVSFVEDPNPVLRNPCLAAGQSTGVLRSNDCNIPAIISRIPQIQTRELESMLKVQNGQIAVMGGLIQDRAIDNEDSVPGLNRIPIARYAFENRLKVSEKTELVIFLRPIIVRDPSIDGDFRGYRVLLPGEDFMTRPNPGRRELDLGIGGARQ
jgi:MSHA biogenesis protein MshL